MRSHDELMAEWAARVDASRPWLWIPIWWAVCAAIVWSLG